MIAGVAGLGMTIFGAVLCCFCPPAIGLFAVSTMKMLERFDTVSLWTEPPVSV
jgi:hypothetical protein